MPLYHMTPAPGARLLRFVGDRLSFRLRPDDGGPPPGSWRAFLRTNLGRAGRLRQEIIHAHTGRLGLAAASWRDIPMTWADGAWHLDLTLPEVGFFKAKAYAVDVGHRQHWPEGPDVGVSVHPDRYRTRNTIYCAFPRMFGATRTRISTQDARQEKMLTALDRQGYTVIPRSGTFRDLIGCLDHIMGVLGCRILHLLPVNPTPAVYARFGRFGSPYACQDLLAVDPALVEFDRRTTGVDQFRELTYAAHLRGGRIFLDVVINHTGWGSTLQENHPEWFVRSGDGTFVSPGAWSVVWKDLVEMHHANPALWEYLGDVFLEWCRRGVDGFRCDAGYKIPAAAWQYITARVLDEFPETIFLLEGLGGPWETTESLLTEGGMQWAYSELFQNYTGAEVARYLDYGLAQSRRVGLYIHYSETHDNNRLAAQGRLWSLMRNRLCALASVSGGYGFTCGVEWLAAEKIDVHESRGLAWDNPDNLVAELARLNRLLADHPAFFDNADIVRLSDADTPVLLLRRTSQEGKDALLIFVNTDIKAPHEAPVPHAAYTEMGSPALDLLSGTRRPPHRQSGDRVLFKLAPGESLCLAATETPAGLSGEAYRRTRALAAWAVSVISRRLSCEQIGPHDWPDLAREAGASPERFLTAIDHLSPAAARQDLMAAIRQAPAGDAFPRVICWMRRDARRTTPVPPDHWLLVRDDAPFRVEITAAGETRHVQSIRDAHDGHFAAFPPGLPSGDARLRMERFHPDPSAVEAPLRFLRPQPDVASLDMAPDPVAAGREPPHKEGLALLANGRGGMARMQVDLGAVRSKYDCVLGANLHASVPVDRHIFVKRIRVWAVTEGFVTPLNGDNLIGFTPGPPAEWRFVASAGDGCAVEIHLTVDMLPDKNATVLKVYRPDRLPAFGRDFPDESRVSLTLRPDLLDRNFHWETHRNGAADHHFATHTHPLPDESGFAFTPEAHRRMRAWTTAGRFHPEPEWSMGLQHPVERSRGQVDHEDAYSPGWFELPMKKGDTVLVTFSAEEDMPPSSALHTFVETRHAAQEIALVRSGFPPEDRFGQRLALAAQAYRARRDDGCTVIAGYPWFLDWGRDSLICARGLLAAGLTEEVRDLLVTFGRFAEQGTLPNIIHGENASNRDTSDAPLWYGLVAEEMAAQEGAHLYDTVVDRRGRTLRDVLQEIAAGYRDGAPNGVRLDASSGLIWSPSHFTWMDTSFPAGTPREGYPVEIQALWIRLCRHLARIDEAERAGWTDLADRALEALQSRFWLEDSGYTADLLIARAGQPAAEARVDNALRSNYLIPIALGLITGEQARRGVMAAIRHLIVPGALRSLAPLPVSPPLPICAGDGRLLNNPEEPYWGRYEGDEDTRRKPAYHNGTAWTWPFPIFCEALARAWDFDREAVQAARAYLGSMDRLLTEGCLGHIPEILDGDTPHAQRGCDAQAWGVTEALRVWKLLEKFTVTHRASGASFRSSAAG